jgi:hypothetical protein
MKHGWQELTKLSQGADLLIERVSLEPNGIAIEGHFELPPLAKLKLEDQLFIMAFVKSHGSIKEMERVFGVSYPTIKIRLNRLSQSFDFVEAGSNPVETVAKGDGVLDRLERGEISAKEALRFLRVGPHLHPQKNPQKNSQK